MMSHRAAVARPQRLPRMSALVHFTVVQSRTFFAVTALGSAAAACGDDQAPFPYSQTSIIQMSADSTRAGGSVAARRVYFAHQSVGNEIVRGIETLVEGQPAPVRVIQTNDPSLLVRGPAFVHFRAGRNGDPESKNAALIKALDARPARDGGIVALKYCYSDVESPLSAAEIFARYEKTVETIRARHPDLTVVHFTMPLTAVESAFKASLKEKLGKSTQRSLARKRQDYNELLRAAYRNREPVFDIAGLEARTAGGTLSGFVAEGKTIETMSPEYTYDGGHLNPHGQRYVARHFLDFLSRVGTGR